MKLLKLLLIAILVIATLPLPYGYYQFLRVLVSFTLTYDFILNRKNLQYNVILIYIIVIIIFNPVFPIYLNRELWVMIDFVVAILVAISILSKKVPSKS